MNWTLSENRFQSFDGAELFYRAWAPKNPSNKALILIHRGHEHSGRVELQVSDLALKDYWAFSWDCRGHGLSPGERGHAESYYHHVQDLNAFAHFISATHGIPIENMALVANSVGAVTASTWVHDYAPPVRAMVLAAPAFRIKLYIPFAIPLLRVLRKIRKKATISSYVKSKMLTHDPEQSKHYDEDPLITRDISVNVLLGLHDTSTRILKDAGAIHTPTMVLSAGSDWVVKNSAQRKFFEGLSSPTKVFETLPGFYHAILYEKDRKIPLSKAREFILKAFDQEPSRTHLLESHRTGFTRDEYDSLRQPTSLAKSLSFGFQRLSLKTIGRLSQGIRLGWQTGFDSGRTLDYVYENQAQGTTFLGRWIDRTYLDSVGWRGIRQRGKNLKALLARAIGDLSDQGKPVRIVDVAAGPGRYVLEVASEKPAAIVSVHLRDRDPQNLKAGQTLASTLNLKDVIFEEADAFDRTSYENLKPRPTIVIVSGLYELFPDNSLVLESLRGIADALELGGFLIYTGQPWHPQVEMIARTLINRDGNPWIMRRRTQAEMDELVRSVGLTKTHTEIDTFGIFTVSLAVKGAPVNQGSYSGTLEGQLAMMNRGRSC